MGQVQATTLMEESILCLPTSLSIELVGRWLRLRDVSCIDKSMCSNAVRASWLELLAQKELVLNNSGSDWWKEERFIPFMRWCLARKVRISEFSAHDLNCELQVYSTGKPFFELICNELERLGISRSPWMGAGLPSFARCPRLRRLDLGNCKIDDVDARFIFSVDTLEELHLYYCSFIDPIIRYETVMKSLRVLSLASSLSVDAARCVLSICPNLSDLRLYVMDKKAYLLLEAVARCNRNLTVLALYRVPGATDEVLSDTFSKLSNLRVVTFGYDINPRDEAVDTLINCCPHLHALYFESCMYITDATLHSIALHCADRLTHLTFTDCPKLTMKAVLHVVKRCQALVELGIGSMAGDEDEEDETDVNANNTDIDLEIILLNVTPQLTSLDLSGMEISTEAISVICERFRDLQYLRLNSPLDGTDLLCLPQIVDSLPSLSCLCATKHELQDSMTYVGIFTGWITKWGFFYTEEDVQAWKEQRPHLMVVEEDDGSPFWRQYQQAKFPHVPREAAMEWDDDEEEDEGEFDDAGDEFDEEDGEDEGVGDVDVGDEDDGAAGEAEEQADEEE